MSWRKLVLFLLALVLLTTLSSSEIMFTGSCIEAQNLGIKEVFLPPGNHYVYLDLHIVSDVEARAVITFKARDQLSWFLISAQYAQQRADLAADLEKFIADILWVDSKAIKRRGIEIDVEKWEIWLIVDVNLSSSTSISKKGREIQVCLRDPLYEGLYEGVVGWIDQINVSVAEGLKIIGTSPSENIVDFSENSVLWVIPSMERASPSYCLNIRLKGLALPSWVLVVISFVILVLLYLILSKKLRKPSEKYFLSL